MHILAHCILANKNTILSTLETSELDTTRRVTMKIRALHIMESIFKVPTIQLVSETLLKII